MLRYLYLLFFLIFFAPFAFASSAMGVSPPSSEIIYIGPQHIEGSFDVFPTEEKNIKVYVAYGNLKEYISLTDNQQEIKMHMTGPTRINFFVDLPADLKPGEYKGVIMAEQFLTPEEQLKVGFIGAFAAIGYVIKVRVPNEGKFLEGEMRIEPSRINTGDTVFLFANLLNFGTEELQNLETAFLIKDPMSTIIAERKSNSIPLLQPAQTGQLKVYWETKGRSAGIYPVEATIEYGGAMPLALQSNIRVGDIIIRILNTSVNFSSSVAKIFIDVESNWNDNIENVYAKIKIKGNSQIIDEVKTSAINLEPWGKGRLTGYWERGSTPPGDYIMEIFVYYYDKQTGREMSVRLPDLEKPSVRKESPLLLIVVVLLAILVVVNVIWLFVSMKSKQDKKKQSKNQKIHKK